MIRCPDNATDAPRIAAVEGRLQTLNTAFRRRGAYADLVRAARGTWKKAQHDEAALFTEVRALLGNLYAGGPGICMYCERSEPGEIDHFRSMTWYPEHLFSWVNYIHACSVCNKKKGSKLRLYDASQREIRYKRARGVITAPPLGSPMFINPRVEDPMTFFKLDLDTGILSERAASGSLDHRRAKHTLSQLHLNKRSLPEQRVAVYRRAYRESLDGYVRQKLSGNPPAHPDLTHLTHRLVWEEMKRQATRPDLAPLFAAAPEALAW